MKKERGKREYTTVHILMGGHFRRMVSDDITHMALVDELRQVGRIFMLMTTFSPISDLSTGAEQILFYFHCHVMA
jgi:hypothetical protein